jgi:23S rRNA (guanosine2251-2'-O)-methyltransferase
MNKISRLNSVYEIVKVSPHRINKIMIQKDIRKGRIDEIIELARKQRLALLYVPRKHLDRIDRKHQGLIAFVTQKEFSSLDDILSHSENPVIILLDGIEDPQNLGAIIRTAVCAGVDGIVLPERRSSGLTDVVDKVSAGGLEHIKVAQVTNLARTIDLLKKKGFWVVGAEAGGEKAWDAFDYTGPVALVFGSEGKGIRQLSRDNCDVILSLPVKSDIGSLNVAAAAAVFMYEVVRQRNKQNTKRSSK